jgi:GDPmannose 4,6-dehydratase
VREFVELAFNEVDVRIRWEGEGSQERGLCDKTNRTLVSVDPRYFRPTEVDILLGNPAKARAKLGWTHKVGFRDLVREMVASDLEEAESRSSNPYEPR